jgi:hypothetical protein
MSRSAFELSAIGGPWARRIAPRRAWLDELPWDEPLPQSEDARWVWTQTAFSEYASAAAFADIAAALAAAAAPIDLTAAAADFVVDEIVHTEASARLAAAVGGAVALEVDLERIVRPAAGDTPHLRAAERIVRTCCVGEALTVPLLQLAGRTSGSVLVRALLDRIAADEAAHASLGGWFLDWADAWLSDVERSRLGRVAGAAVRSFAPLLRPGCGVAGAGLLSCESFDPLLRRTVERRVVRPLAARGITVPAADLAALGVGA